MNKWRHTLSAIGVIASTSFVYGQSTFVKEFDLNGCLEIGWSIKEADTGYWLLADTWCPSENSWKLLLYRLDEVGDTLFRKVIEREGARLDGGDIEVLPDGNVLMAATVYNPDSSIRDFLLVKVNTSGDSLWSKQYNIGGGFKRLRDIEITGDNGIIMSGYVMSYPTPDSWDYYVVRTDSSGNLLWQNHYGDSSIVEQCYDVLPKSDGGYLLVGNNPQEIYLVEIDDNGNQLWDTTYGYSDLDFGNMIIECSDGGYMIAGKSFISFDNGEGYLLKTDSSLKREWDAFYEGPGSHNFWSIAEVADASYVIAGSGVSNSKQDGWLLKVDLLGNEIWNHKYTPEGTLNLQHDYFWDMSPTSDGGFIMCGQIDMGQSGTQDAWVVKVDSSGLCDTASCWPWLVGVSPQPEAQRELYVSPNPASSLLEIRVPEAASGGLQLSLTNSLGQLVKHELLPAGTSHANIDLGHLSASVYFLRLTDGGTTWMERIVKR